MEFATKCIHEIGAADATGSVTPAIYLSSTFAHPKLGDTTGFNYTRETLRVHAWSSFWQHWRTVSMPWLFPPVWLQLMRL